VPFIPAISDTSPTSQLNVTFLQITRLTQAAAEDDGQRRTTAAASASA
jgi:hypothetical protein